MFSLKPGMEGVSSPNPMHNASLTGQSMDLGSFSGSFSGPPSGKEVAKYAKGTTDRPSKKKRFAPFLVLFAMLLIGGGVAAAFLLTTEDVSATRYMNPAPNNGTVPVTPGAAELALCPEAQLCHLVYVPTGGAAALRRERRLADADQKGYTLARSYALNEWERSADADVDVPIIYFDCSKSGCRVAIPSAPGSFHLVTRARERLTTPKEMTARFLNQATFGVTLNEIDSFPASPKDWITQQLSEPMSSHRAYYRQRVNSLTTLTTPAGRPSKPCEHGSRWESFAFMTSDVDQNVVFAAVAGDLVSVTIGGVLRTEVSNALLALDGTYQVCSVRQNLDGNVEVATPDCAAAKIDIANFVISFSSAPPATYLAAMQGASTQMTELTPDVPGNRIFQMDPTSTCSTPTSEVVFAQSGSQYFRHSPRLVMLDNTVENPAITKSDDEGPSLCSNVEKSFVNSASCVIHRGEACQALRPPSFLFPINKANLLNFYRLTESYVYAVKGLRLTPNKVEESPCSGSYSRWVKSGTGACATPTPLGAGTAATLISLLSGSDDTNPTVRDIRIPSGSECEATGASVGAKLTAGANCWEHVHSDLYNVFDFTLWSQPGQHPGGSNPIRKFARANGAELTFPSHHEMIRWVENRKKLTLIGRFGDEVDFSLLPTSLQSESMAKELGAELGAGDASRAYGESCGSPNEVAGQPVLGARFLMAQNTFDDVNGSDDEFKLDDRLARYRTTTSVWTMIGMYGKDQLRQRMAWALSQILVVSMEQLGDQRTERFLHYYDIFVRHAFGNYRDVLREVSYSPVMGDYLSYTGSHSFQYRDREIFPDENYAREIMQLFTVGLYKLKRDGTVVLGVDNKPVESYTNDDISECSFVEVCACRCVCLFGG
jgi:hypothetical protein